MASYVIYWVISIIDQIMITIVIILLLQQVTLHKFSRELSNYTAMMIPWEGKIKNIESYFGSVVASYFTFLRWLFWINFVMSLICGVVIIMPEVMFGPDSGSVPYKSVPGMIFPALLSRSCFPIVSKLQWLKDEQLQIGLYLTRIPGVGELL